MQVENGQNCPATNTARNFHLDFYLDFPFLRLPPTPLVFSNNFHFSNGVIAFSDGQSDSSSLLCTTILNACLFSSFCKENVGETEALLNLFVKFRLVRGLPPSMGKSNTSFLVSHRVRITLAAVTL